MTQTRLLLLSLLIAAASACGDEDTEFTDTGVADTGVPDGGAGDAGVTDSGMEDVTDDIQADVGAEDTASDVSEDMGIPDVSDDGGTEDSGDDVAPGMDWDAIFEALNANGCAGNYCHGGGAGGLSFSDADSAYTALIGTRIQGSDAACGASERIVPGDADASGLYIRLRPASEDSPECSPEKMPPGSDGVNAELAEALAAWINAGAIR